MTLDSQRALTVLAARDPQFTELVTRLYGAQVDPRLVWRDAFAKSSPDAADVHVPSAGGQRRRPNGLARAAAVTATGFGALLGVKELAEQAPKALRAGATGQRMFRTPAGWVAAATGRGRRVPAGASRLIAATPRPLARALAGAPVPGPATRATGTLAMFGGDILATHQLRNQDDIEKSVLSELADGFVHQTRQVTSRLLAARTGGTHVARKVKPAAGQHTLLDPAGRPSAAGATVGDERMSATRLGVSAGNAYSAATATPGRKAATAAAVGGTALVAARHHGGGGQPTYPGPTPYYYSKRSERTPVEVEWAGTFAKFDNDKRLAFGWATVSKLNGSVVLDRQDDVVLPEDIEDAVYAYNLHSRVGGDMHRRTVDDRPVQVGGLVESMMFTDEKCAALGLPAEFNRGWWVGFHYPDDQVWHDVKIGKKAGFSIHGKGYRAPIDYDDLMAG